MCMSNAYNLRMKLKFTKMHGAGNDFIVIDAINQHIEFTSEQWKRLSDRRFGVGADQILVVEKAQSATVDFRYRIYNADGGEVEQCGNGSRAFVKFVTDKGLTNKRAIKVETMSGIIEPKLEENGQITVDMGAPVLDTALVPFDTTELIGKTSGNDTLWPLEVNNKLIYTEGTPSVVGITPSGATNPTGTTNIDPTGASPSTAGATPSTTRVPNP